MGIVACVDVGVSDGPVETRLDGGLEHLRGIGLGFFEPGSLHVAVVDPPRTVAGPDQRTVNCEEPGRYLTILHQVREISHTLWRPR